MNSQEGKMKPGDIVMHFEDLPWVDKDKAWKFSYRCAVLPKGSRLCGGGYKK